MERVGIEFYGKGIEELTSSVRELQSLVDLVTKRKYRMAFEIKTADIKRQFDTLKNQKIKLNFDISALRSQLASVNNKRNNILGWLTNNADASGTKIYRDLQQMYARLDNQSKGLNAELKTTKARYNEISNALKLVSAEFRQITSEAKAATIQQDLYNQAVSNLTGRIAKVGSRMQTLGKALQSITSPFSRILNGFVMGIGYRALNKVTSGLSGAFERYDTMHTYSAQLVAMGHKAEDATAAIEKLRDSVLGLPTGLDEIVASQKAYVGATNDVERATELAIAANNAYIAGGTTAKQKKYIQNQLLALASGAELTTSQWQSLQRNAPMALRAVAEELGYADDKYADFLEDLKKGNIEGKKFLDAFIKQGTEGRLSKAATVMKLTWNALSENISNATKRLGQNVIEAFDEVFQNYNGRNLVQNLLGFDKEGHDLKDGIKDWFDSLGASIGDWIRNNPDRIIKFFENLKKLDIKGFLKGIADFYLPLIEKAVELLGKIDGSKLSKFMLGGNLAGGILTTAGGITKGLASPIAKGYLFSQGITKKGGYLGTIAAMLAGDGGLGTAMMFSSVMNKVGSAGGGVAAAGKTIEGVADVGATAAATAKKWQGLAGKAIAVAAIPAIAGSLLLFAKAFKEVEGLHLNFKQIQTFVGNAILVLTEFGGYAEAIGFLLTSSPIGWAAALNEGVGVATIMGLTGTLVALAEAMGKIADAKLPGKTKIDAVTKNFELIIPAIQSVVDSLSGNKGIIVGWTKKSEAKSAKSIIESFSSIIDTFIGMTDSLGKLSKVKGITKKLSKATSVISELGEGLEPLKRAIMKAFGSYEQSYVEGDTVTTQTREKKFEESAASEYEQMTSSIATVFSNISRMIDNLITMRDKLNNMRKQVKMKKFKKNLGELISDMNEIIMGAPGEQSLYTLGQNALWVKDKGIDNVANAFYSIGVIIDRLQEVSNKAAYAKEGSITMKNVQEAVHGISALAKIMVNVDTFPTDAARTAGDIDNVGNAIEKIGQLANKIRVAASLIGGGVEDELANIREFLGSVQFNGMQNLYGSINFQFEVDFGDTTTQVYSAVWNEFEALSSLIDTMNLYKERTVTVKFIPDVKYLDVLTMIRGAHYAINEALRWTLSPINRTVTINLNGNVNRNNLNTEYPYTGGLITDHGLLYRARGGSIFKPRGTDIVPAMLTPGEYVMSRNAVDTFGARFMQRINNLDIPGAIRELSIRTGRKLAPTSQIVNNNTDNRSYSNVQHINTNNPNFAFRRSRWVSELR